VLALPAAGFASEVGFAVAVPEGVEPAVPAALAGAGLEGAASGFAGAAGLSLGG
jgi:hypothetical protein